MPLQITIEGREIWNEKTQEFIQPPKSQTITLEHSLVSISKWEAKYHKPFLTDTKKTIEETIDYVRCMTISQNVDPALYDHLSNSNITDIYKYIEDPMTATWFNEIPGANKGKRKSEQVTSELIYYWMVALQIPFEAQKWHLNRLLTLVRICNIKNNPGKKQSKKEIMSKNAALNAERKRRLGTSG